MWTRPWSRRGRSLVLCMAALAATLLVVPSAPSAEPAKGPASLQLVPEDAAFYSAMLRNREQLEAVLHSKAWARLQSLAAVQFLKEQLQQQLKQPGSPFAQAQAFFSQPENQELLAMLGDMFSDEIFVYGGNDFIQFTEVMGNAMGAARYGPAVAALSGQDKGKKQETEQFRQMLLALQHDRDKLKVPDLVIGFHLKHPDVAVAQLKRLEALAQGVFDQNPALKGRFKKTKIGDGSFLSVTLDGSMIPWQQVPLKEIESEAGEFDPLVKKLQTLTFQINLGVRGSFLLLSLGGDDAGLKRLGTGKSLAGRSEFKRLEPFLNKRLTSVSYASKTFRTGTNPSKQNVAGMGDAIQSLLKNVKTTDEERKELEKDLKEFMSEVQTHQVDPGAMLGFSFLTDRGQESFHYDWTQSGAKPTQPLTLLDHIGGAPVLAVVGRSSFSVQDYQHLVKWLKKANHHFEVLALPQLDENARAMYEKIAAVVHPQLKKLDEVNSTLLIPSLDGQCAFVLDARVSSKQWVQQMPPAEKPLPMLEPAIVWGVRDAEKLAKACGEYRTVINETIVKVGETVGQDLSHFQIPDPQTKKVANGTLYYYTAPEQWGIDKQLALGGGIGKDAAAFTIAPKHTERLLAPTPPRVSGGPLAFRGHHLSSAVYVNWEGLMNAVEPWADYAIALAGPNIPPLPFAPGQNSADVVREHVRTVLEVLKCIRGYTSATYFEDGVWVTHGETVIHDLDGPKP